MGEIRIGPTATTIMLVALLALLGVTLKSELPDLKRYLKIKQM